MPDNKLVIRRLPPSMSEDDFLKQVSPLPDHDYFCFFEADSNLRPHSYSRAYINFLDSSEMTIFRERFDNYVFLDREGHEYPAVVEQSLWHKSARGGPFYRNISSESLSIDGQLKITRKSQAPANEGQASSNTPLWIEQDPEFIEFVEKLHAQKKRPQHSPIQTLETNLDELTNSSTTCLGGKDNARIVTPLIGYVNQQRSLKSSKKAK